MKFRLKNIITIRVVSQKLLNNVLDEAKMELPSMFHPVTTHDVTIHHFGSFSWHDLSLPETLLAAGIVVLGLSLISRQFEIKGESKLKPFVDASKIHSFIKYILFLIIIVGKYYYYTTLPQAVTSSSSFIFPFPLPFLFIVPVKSM